MAIIYDLARMNTATEGTGTITLTTAVPGAKTFAAAGVGDGETVSYAIADGAQAEVGRGVYTAAGTTLTRSVTGSTNSDAAIDLSGSAQVFITALAQDIPTERGSLYIHEGAVNVDISDVGQGVYVKITGLTTGLLNNVTVNSDAFNVGKVGVYEVFWQISGDSQGQNKDYEVDIFLNGVEQDDGSARREFGATGSLGSMSGQGHINVTNTSHDIDIRVKETGSGVGTDFDIFNMQFNLKRIG